MHAELSTLSLPELRELAKSYRLKGVSTLRKPELMRRIMEFENPGGSQEPAGQEPVEKKSSQEKEKPAVKKHSPGRPRKVKAETAQKEAAQDAAPELPAVTEPSGEQLSFPFPV